MELLETMVSNIKSQEQMEFYQSWLLEHNESEKTEIRAWIANTPTTPYTAVISVLLNNPEPDYKQLLSQLE